MYDQSVQQVIAFVAKKSIALWFLLQFGNVINQHHNERHLSFNKLLSSIKYAVVQRWFLSLQNNCIELGGYLHIHKPFEITTLCIEMP